MTSLPNVILGPGPEAEFVLPVQRPTCENNVKALASNNVTCHEQWHSAMTYGQPRKKSIPPALTLCCFRLGQYSFHKGEQVEHEMCVKKKINYPALYLCKLARSRVLDSFSSELDS
ncbi:hypothetical protein RRG08_023410 [Elysia crispata]|uniref:Uncharacterized protein n=1 Tax=Elysia crispata TaxID=231223 RepID=A0AAE0YDZ9_9GAST|nr:hypothetical protein RRG08_023410 [Elysia crispata]